MHMRDETQEDSNTLREYTSTDTPDWLYPNTFFFFFFFAFCEDPDHRHHDENTPKMTRKFETREGEETPREYHKTMHLIIQYAPITIPVDPSLIKTQVSAC